MDNEDCLTFFTEELRQKKLVEDNYRQFQKEIDELKWLNRKQAHQILELSRTNECLSCKNEVRFNKILDAIQKDPKIDGIPKIDGQPKIDEKPKMVDVSTETIKKKTLKVTFACQTDAVKECTIKAHDGATERLDELLAKNQRLAADNEILRTKSTQLKEEVKRLHEAAKEQNQKMIDEFKTMLQLENTKDANIQKMMSDAEKTHEKTMLEKDKEIQNVREQMKIVESQIRLKEKKVEEHLSREMELRNKITDLKNQKSNDDAIREYLKTCLVNYIDCDNENKRQIAKLENDLREETMCKMLIEEQLHSCQRTVQETSTQTQHSEPQKNNFKTKPCKVVDMKKFKEQLKYLPCISCVGSDQPCKRDLWLKRHAAEAEEKRLLQASSNGSAPQKTTIRRRR